MTTSDKKGSANAVERTQNPLLDLGFRIPFDTIHAAHVEPAMDELIADAQRNIDGIVAAAPRSYDTTLAALERATEKLERASGVVSHLESVATTPAFRDAYEAIQPKLSRFWSGVVLNEGLWQVLRAFAETDEARALSGTRRRHLQKVLDEFRRQGAELETEEKRRLEAINVELAELTNRFSQNVLDATNAFELIIDVPARLAGLPESAMEAARESAREKGIDGWRFTLHAPSLNPVLKYLDDADLRAQIWRAYHTRATSGRQDNRPIVRRVLALRREKARLLGYADFADLALEDRMAGSGARARAFIRELHDLTREHFVRENAVLESFYRQTAPNGAQLQPSDVGYYAEKQRRTLYDFDEESLRPFFSAERVLDGLFRTAQRLYGVRVEPAHDLPVWDAAVRTYTLTDADGRHLASFYIDLYPRESKRGGAWMHGLITSPPPAPHLALICANFNPPVAGKPALLTHQEVETLFHEFGHLLHHCLSTVPVRSLGGTNVAWDFVELPSQIMENWCWERSALDLFARHYETDEPIPPSLFEKMRRARTYRAANAQTRQVGFAAVDFALHCDYDAEAEADVMTLANRVMQEYSPTPLPPDYGLIAGFSHLFASPVGYAAGYYSYKWSEVLDADAFSRFRESGVFSREAGLAFRETILARGDSAEPMELYKAFMGREPDLRPLLIRQGLARD